jgi:hypothetical protein
MSSIISGLNTAALTITHAAVQAVLGYAFGTALTAANYKVWYPHISFNHISIMSGADKELYISTWQQFSSVFLEFLSNISLTAVGYSAVLSVVMNLDTSSDPSAGMAFLLTAVFSNFFMLLQVASMTVFIYGQLNAYFNPPTSPPAGKNVEQTTTFVQPQSGYRARVGNSPMAR